MVDHAVPEASIVFLNRAVLLLEQVEVVADGFFRSWRYLDNELWPDDGMGISSELTPAILESAW